MAVDFLKLFLILLFSNEKVVANLMSMKNGVQDIIRDIPKERQRYPSETKIVSIASNGKPSPSEAFDHDIMLDTDGAFWLFWSANETHVTFETHVKTHGYIGFGLSSENGQMYPADVVVGWVHDGKTTLKDCHTVGHVMPVEDESQNWILLHGEETDFGTTLKFTRKLDTCDEHDQKITDDTTRVIYSYHPDDPLSITSLPWHGRSRRGTKSLLLLSAISTSNVEIPSDARTFDIVKTNFHVPARQTTYQCTTHRLPALTQKHHVIKPAQGSIYVTSSGLHFVVILNSWTDVSTKSTKIGTPRIKVTLQYAASMSCRLKDLYEPVITPGNEKHVHHIVISVFQQPIDHKYENMSYDCMDSSHTPEPLKAARSIFIAWAVGGRIFYYPNNTGIPIGTASDPSFFLMETHYDNPSLKSDIIDNSGIRITYTPTLRQYDAGLLYVEYYTNPTLFIPPHDIALTVQAYCSEECLTLGIPDDGLYVFGVFHHAHLLGRKMKTRHFRNSSEIEPFASDDHYDFNFQDVRVLKPYKKLLKGDSIIVECTYDSRSKTRSTYGGISTEEEMCVSTLLYYPRMSVSGCLTEPLYEQIHQSDSLEAVKMMKNWNWTEPSVRQHFKTILRQSTYQHFCGDTNVNQHHITNVTIPQTSERFTANETSPCATN